MSWHCSQALVAEFSAATCSDGDACAQSSTTPTPAAYYWPDKTTEHSRLSRFGMTSEPLTAGHGEELLTWYRAGFRARTSAQPAREQGSKASEADCGPKWHGSFARYDRASSSWKTAQCSLVEDLERFSETWPRWGSMRNGACWERITPELRTSGKESGFWPTVRASDGERGGRGDLIQAVRGNANSHFRMYPTPTASNTKANHMRGSDKGKAREPRSYGATGPLNPRWIEWLMGWPMGWTKLGPLEMGRFHEWQQEHSLNLPAVSNREAA